MNILEKLSELTVKTGDLTEQIIQSREFKVLSQNFKFDPSIKNLSVDIEFRPLVARPIFVGIRNLVFRKAVGSSGVGQSIIISLSFGNDETAIELNAQNGIQMMQYIDFSLFGTYFFIANDQIGEDNAVSLNIAATISTGSYSLVSQGDAVFFLTYI